ncbi:magnesium transporter MgtE N-terminal domain-containing protein [Mycolicibacterium sp. 120270]|uniref:magnesium transporter MgtE N-terminal domain-containing protein n=1 Tax=Mycolicibacterium sp. 120270 TaxID=3090600 RepID=UPI00299F0C40|nr:magnesium transporter [Mycolicibacterium sp. 120270]MDX1885981.1 magnesium transporter [Mycolicibacterium sp. 120270]
MLGSGELALVDKIAIQRVNGAGMLVPWDVVGTFAHSDIHLKTNSKITGSASSEGVLDSDEILLAREVLDTQVFDIAGQRLARVGDVVLAHRHNRMEVVGAEVGFGAVLRRLGLARLAERQPVDLVPWTELHLTSERGHAVQLATPRSAVHLLDARGLATLIAHLDTDSATEVLASKEADVAADVIRSSHPVVGERVLRAMSADRAASIVAAMPPHHATHWQNVLATSRSLRDRHFLRSGVWPRRHLSRALRR